MGLLDIATVETGDGQWTAGYEVESWGCGVGEYITDLCTPDPIHVAGAEYRESDGGTPGSVKIVPFSFVAGIARNTRYFSDTDVPRLAEFIAASETPVAYVFSRGFAGYEGETLATAASNDKPSVTTVAAGASTQETIISLLEAWSNRSTFGYDSAVLHLGVSAAFSLSSQPFVSEAWSVLNEMEIDVAISPGYPTDFVALTGPIVIRLSSIQVLKATDALHNKIFFEATRLAAIEYDPCLAFVSGS